MDKTSYKGKGCVSLKSSEFCAMQILLCAATEAEIKPAVNFISTNNLPVEILITGVGLPAAMYAITKKVCSQKFGYIVQAGVAGAFNVHLHLGQVVIVESDTIGDLGVKDENSFQSLFDMGFVDANESPWSERRLVNTTKDYEHLGLSVVNGITVNEISTDAERIRFYNKLLGADVETMEGAALHYVGIMEGLRFIQIRSISNYVGERDKKKWDLHDAIKNLNTELQRVLNRFFYQ
jgi:futalosine hydrolase